jgi:hypothetical protein
MNIVVKSLVSDHVSSSAYTLDRCEWVNKTIPDVLYLPKIENIPPILDRDSTRIF